MSNPTSTEYEKYYVPEQSKMAIMATIGLILSIFGAASIMNDMTFGDLRSLLIHGRFFSSGCSGSWLCCLPGSARPSRKTLRA